MSIFSVSYTYRAISLSLLILAALPACRSGGKPAPTQSSATPAVEPSPHTPAIRAGMVTAAPALTACQETASAPIAPTRARLELDGNGRVSSLTWIDGAPPEPLQTCYAKALTSIAFDATAAGQIVSIPLPIGSGEDTAAPEAIRASIRANLPAIRACYDAALVSQPTLAGTVIASFRVEPDGSASQVKASGLDTKVDGCVADAIRAIKFGIGAAAPVEVKAYPIAFAPAAP